MTLAYPDPEPHYHSLTPPNHHFNTIVGHEAVKRMLWKMVHSQRLPQALLFRGGRGVGKRSLVYALAKIINGEASDVSDAHPTRAASNIASGEYLDLRVVRPEGPGGQIRIDDIRDISDWAYMTPVEARRKIIIIEDADRMNVASANCFLKTLEEPPTHCVIALTTSQPHILLPTIRSRCSAVYLRPAPQDQLEEWLMGCFRMDPEQARMAALLADGRPGHALEQLVVIQGGARDDGMDLWDQVATQGQEDSYGVSAEARRQVGELVALFYREGFASVFGVAAGLLAVTERSLEGALTLMLMWYRDLMLRAVVGAANPMLVNRDLPEEAFSGHCPSDPVLLGRSMRLILDATGDTRRPGIDAQLALESLLTRLGELR